MFLNVSLRVLEFVGTTNVTCSSSSAETTVKWLKVELTEEYREVIFSIDCVTSSFENILRAPENCSSPEASTNSALF